MSEHTVILFSGQIKLACAYRITTWPAQASEHGLLAKSDTTLTRTLREWNFLSISSVKQIVLFSMIFFVR